MAIVIKKRVNTNTVEPEPVVEMDEVVAPRTPVIASAYDLLPVASSADELTANPGTMRAPEPTTCKLCGHTYGYPCHGESAKCLNAVFAKSIGKTVAA